MIDTEIQGLKIIEPSVYGDQRGWFIESYNVEQYKKNGIELSFIQDNHSFSAKKGTLRGLHYQLYPKEQTKLVRCTRGRIFDVAVDLRHASSTYGKWFGIELGEENKRQLLIPKGFAHGFLTLTDNVEVQYKVDELYSPKHDRTIKWNDDVLMIDWGVSEPILSEKDKVGLSFRESEKNFSLKALVTGVDGQLGNDVMKKLEAKGYDVYGTSRETMDITNVEQVKQVFESFKPDVVIHCAAYTEVDRAEVERQKCYAVNVEGTKYLVSNAKRCNSKFVYISTDYVFDGEGNHLWQEEDNTVPINYYGYTKKLGEEVVRNSLLNHFIVRTSWVYGENGNNFVKTMFNLAKTNNTIKVVDDQIGSPTHTKDLADFLEELIQTEAYGTYHSVNSGFCSWAEFATEIFKILNKDVTVIPVNSKQYPSIASRPKNSRLSTMRMQKNINYQMPPWEVALEQYLMKSFRGEFNE